MVGKWIDKAKDTAKKLESEAKNITSKAGELGSKLEEGVKAGADKVQGEIASQKEKLSTSSEEGSEGLEALRAELAELRAQVEDHEIALVNVLEILTVIQPQLEALANQQANEGEQ